MKHTLLLLLFVALSVPQALAQRDTTTAPLSGRIVDNTGAAVPFAHVLATAVDSSASPSGTTTDDDGRFCFRLLPGTYRLAVSSAGYERLAMRCDVPAQGLQLGDVTLNAKQLQAVTVTSQRVTEQVDRYVVLPKPEETAAAGRTIVLLDMLQLPGLKVDVALQQITIDGGPAILQIGGKEVPVTRLANLRADQIKRVEYSNNPGTRYLDRGITGIINIILKEREDGGSLMANGQSALTTGFVNGYLQGSYHKGKSEWVLEYNLGYRNYHNVPYELEDSYLDPARTVRRTQHTNMPFWYINHTLSAEYTYQHDDSTMFVAALKDDFFTKTLQAHGTMTETDRGISSTQTLERLQHQRDNLPSLDLYFTHRMAAGQKLELNLVGEYATNCYDNTLTYRRDGIPTAYATDVTGHGYAISAEAAYSKRFGATELRTGLQYQHNFSENDYTLQSTVTSMSKDNAYLYAELAGPLGPKVGYSVRTGAKLFNVSDRQRSKPYLCNLSSARLQWRINPQFSLTATAQLTPILPTLASLSPVFQQTDDVEGQQGNPDLRPAQQLQSSLMLRYTHPKGFYALAQPGLFHIFNTWLDGYHYDAERDLFVHSYHSADRWHVPYLYGEVGTRGLWQCLNLSLSGTYYHYLSEGPEFSHSADNFTAMLNAQFFWKGLVAGASFTLLPEWRLISEEKQLSEMAQTVYVQYRWRSLTASAMWLCPLNPDGYRYETVGLSAVHPFRHIHHTAENGNMIVLGLTWQMDFGRRFNKGEKTLHNGGYDNGMLKAGS